MLQGPNGSSQYRIAVKFLILGRSRNEEQIVHSRADSSIRHLEARSPLHQDLPIDRLSRPEEGTDRSSTCERAASCTGREAEASTIRQLGWLGETNVQSHGPKSQKLIALYIVNFLSPCNVPFDLSWTGLCNWWIVLDWRRTGSSILFDANLPCMHLVALVARIDKLVAARWGKRNVESFRHLQSGNKGVIT